MLLEAEQCQANPREIDRHIGDFTMFWLGVYPETLSQMKSPDRRDHLVDYFQQGKRRITLPARSIRNLTSRRPQSSAG